MSPKIEINSLSCSKLKSDQPFVKYNIEASLDEVENRDSEVSLKYKLVLLSNPTNTKITVEGLAKINGDQVEISKQLGPDEKNIPVILNSIYQEVFPLFFIMSKSMQIPCPAYRLSQMSASAQTQKAVSEPVQESPNSYTEIIPNSENESDKQIEIVSSSSGQGQIIEQEM